MPGTLLVRDFAIFSLRLSDAFPFIFVGLSPPIYCLLSFSNIFYARPFKHEGEDPRFEA